MKRRQILSLATSFAGISLTGYGSNAVAQVANLNDAINKAGRQRMLSQRMAKSYMSLGLDVVSSQADKTLTESIGLFDRQLVELKVFAPRPEIKAVYQSLEGVWSDYKAALVGKTASHKDAFAVLALGDEVLALANQGTLQLEKVSGKPVGRLVNIAGRQRMLSQRMASHYLAASWNVDAVKSKAVMLKARDEFVTALEVLRSAPEATPRIKQELGLADQQFIFFQAALGNLKVSSADKRPLVEVFQTSERILQVMDNITGFYSQIT
jgi:Type IV pili methyl-accepting chemotaxis transducer N-term